MKTQSTLDIQGERGSEVDPLEHEALLPSYSKQPRRCLSKRFIALSILTLSLLVMLVIDIAIHLQRPSCESNPYHTYFDNHISNAYETHHFTDNVSSPFRSPTPEGEAAWMGVIGVGFIGINEEQRDAIGAAEDSFRPTKLNGQYLANLAVFHQLHCVRILWQFSYRDYFQTREPAFFAEESEEKIHEHLDHCADIVRQALMCHADTSIITWRPPLEGHRDLRPTYDQPRTCRVYEEIVAWGKKHEAHYP